MRKTHLQRLVQISTGREIEELLTDLYVKQGRSDQEIADALGGLVTRAAIGQWREELGIKRPPLEPLIQAEQVA